MLFAWRGIYMTAELVKKWLIPRLISGNLAIWTVLTLEKAVLYCFWVPREINLRFCNKTQWQMFLLVSGRHVGAHPDGHQHGVSIQSSVNLGNTLLRMAREWKIAETRFLARLFIMVIDRSGVQLGLKSYAWFQNRTSAQWVRFEITRMISDQNCTTRSSVATLLDPFWNRTIFGEKQ